MDQTTNDLRLVGGGRVQTSRNPFGYDALNFHWPSLRLYFTHEWGCLTQSDTEPTRLRQAVESATEPRVLFSWSEVEKVRVLVDYGPTVRFTLSRPREPEWFLFSTLVKRGRNVGKVLDFAETRGVSVSRSARWQSIG